MAASFKKEFNSPTPEKFKSALNSAVFTIFLFLFLFVTYNFANAAHATATRITCTDANTEWASTEEELRSAVRNSSVSCVYVTNDIQMSKYNILWPNHDIRIIGDKNGTGEKITITAKPGCRIFEVWTKHVELSNLILTGGTGPASKELAGDPNIGRTRDGGAIHVECCDGRAVLIIEDSIITGNTARQGGAIYTTGSLDREGCYVYTYRTEFSNNTATGGDGGAIYQSGYSDKTRTWINVTYFHDNSATDQGGAIYHGTGRSLRINRSSFIRNTAKQASAIWKSDYAQEYEPENSYIMNSTIVNNTATGSASGAIRFGYSDRTENHSADWGHIIEHNTIAYNSGGQYGGGLYLAEHITTFRNNIIVGNSVSGQGQDIYMASNNAYKQSWCTKWVDLDCTESKSRTRKINLTSGGYNIIGVSDAMGGASYTSVETDILGTAATPLTASTYLSSLQKQSSGIGMEYYNPINAAKDGIPLASCTLTVDMLNTQRPIGDGCDIGAIEVDLALINLIIEKQWRDDFNRDFYRPSQIQFTIFCDNAECGDNPYTISAADDWSIEIEVPASSTYSVVESIP